MRESIEELRSGVVLAELGGHGDGPYCAKHGAGAALVMLGTYVVDSGDDVPYPSHFVFKPGRSSYDSYLQEHVGTARASGAKVGVSVISVDLAHTVDFLVASQEAGADYVSLCAHSTMEMFTKVGLGQALCCHENFARLEEWATAILDAVRVPLIFKIGIGEPSDTIAAVDAIASSGVPIVHINVGNTDAGSEGLSMLKQLAGRCRLLIGGGGIKDIDDARRVLEAGADAIAIGTAAIKDQGLCGRIQNLLKNG